MDIEILHARLAAAESAILKLDERLDALENAEHVDDHAEALVAHDGRLESLEEILTECIQHLESLEQSAVTTESEIAQAEAMEAVAEAEEAKAEMIEAIIEASQETESEETGIVEELTPEPEPESESAAAPEKSPNWLERFLVLR